MVKSELLQLKGITIMTNEELQARRAEIRKTLKQVSVNLQYFDENDLKILQAQLKDLLIKQI